MVASAASQYRVPDVYYEPQPRSPEVVPVRTDVCGFIGFDPRVTDGDTASTLVGSPAVGHSFQVNVAAFQLYLAKVRAQFAGATDLQLSASGASIPMLPGQSVIYTLAAALVPNQAVLQLVVVTSYPGTYPQTQAVTDDVVAAAVLATLGAAQPWRRLADVEIRRIADDVFPTALPALKATRCDDWNDYLLAFGEPPDDGTLLGPAVRAYFANGGRRCWVATVRRPRFTDATELENARLDMIGVAGSSHRDATGLARLLLEPEVTYMDAPDLYAQAVVTTITQVTLPPPASEACFRRCGAIAAPIVATTANRQPAPSPIYLPFPLFDGAGSSNPVFDTQRALVEMALTEGWRMLVLLSAPLVLDPATGLYVPPVASDADAWRAQFVLANTAAEVQNAGCAAMYWPWVFNQEIVQGPVTAMPPSAFAAGIIARRDVARGPQFSPANERLQQVVGTAVPVDDDDNALLYSPLPGADGAPIPSVNVIRAFPVSGIQLWGARTLSTDAWMQYLVVRRTLTAIELRAKAALERIVFAPNTPALWLHVTHVVLGVLMPIYQSGALQGTTPDQAFTIRCDSTVNTAQTVAVGQLYVEVGVAVAAPSEFIVFRVGRREGVVEVLE